MLPATWIKLRFARGTTILAFHVVVDGQLSSTAATQDCFLCPFTPRPDLDLMVCERLVAVFTCVINATAPHFDRDDIDRCMVMQTSGLLV